MKKYIVCSLCFWILCSSCNDWLDVKPQGQTEEEDMYTTYEGFKDALTGCYVKLKDRDLYGEGLTMSHIESLAQLWDLSGSTRDADLALARYEYENTYAKSVISGIYGGLYNVIVQANSVLRHLEHGGDCIEDSVAFRVLQGEAFAIRAFCHLDVLRLFGQMPQNPVRKVTLPYSEDVSFKNLPRYYDYAAFCGKLESDLLAAENALSVDPVISTSLTYSGQEDDFLDFRGLRLNYYAVKALEARVLQYIGDYKNAAIAAKVVTDQIGEKGKVFSWTNVTTVLANMDYSFFNEVVFGINNPDMLSNYNSFYNKTDINDLYAVDRDNLVQNIYSGFGDNLKAIIDVRARQWTESNDQGGSSVSYSQNGTYISNKFNISANSNLLALVDFQPYYIQAEAALKDGDKKTAAELLNTVSSHRGIPETSFYYLTENDMDEQFYSHIESEYYKEFYGEGQVYFYHKRMKSDQMFPGYGGTSVAVNASAMYIETDI